MNKGWPFLFAAAALGCVGPQVAIKQSYDFSKIKRVAVLDFSGPQGASAADQLVQSLLAGGADVVERSRLSAVLGEAKLGSTGFLDPDTVKQLGKVLGVDALFMGSVTNYSPAQSYLVFTEGQPVPTALGSGSVMSMGPASGVPGSDIITSAASVGLSARMVEVETGSILWSASQSYEGIDVGTALMEICSSFAESLSPVWLPKRR